MSNTLAPYLYVGPQSLTQTEQVLPDQTSAVHNAGSAQSSRTLTPIMAVDGISVL